MPTCCRLTKYSSCVFPPHSWDSQHPEILIANGSPAWRRLRLASELAKKELTMAQVTAIDLAGLASNQV